MRDPSRIQPFCDRLAQLWSTYPDLRFGQLIMNLQDWYYKLHHSDWFYIEDEELIQFLESCATDNGPSNH